MSVRNITDIPQARDLLTTTAKGVRERVEAAKAESLALDKTETDVKIGAAAVLQGIADDREPLIEEIGQLQGILDSIRSAAPAVVTPEPAPAPLPVPAPPAPAPEPEPEPAPAPLPVPAPPAPAPEPAADDLLAQEPAPGLEGPRFNANPRHWSLLQWLLAILGLFIGALVARITVGLVFWVANDPAAWIKTILGTVWYLGWIGVGFFGGGLIGYHLQNRRRN